MASEQLEAQRTNAITTSPEDAEPSTWAAKWDIWWARVGAAGWLLIILDQAIKLERSLSMSSLELKLELATPLVLGVFAASEVWKAPRDRRVEKTTLMLVLFLLLCAYRGMVDLQHLPR